MKSIFLNRLEISSFKGISELTIDFDKATNIYGENALGKTSIFDAFTWLMFDKDSKNRSNFEVKPLDKNNQVVRGLNPTVTAILEINGQQIKLSKMLEEKWSKKRGEAEKTFTGNVTTYEIDDVPVKQSEYKKKIAEIAEEEQFKLLTNPYYFSDSLNWKEIRKLVLEVAGDVTTGQVIDCNKELEIIRVDLEKDDVEILLKSRKASIKKLSDKKKEIPTRINECNRSVLDIDFISIETELTNKRKEIENIENKLLDISKVNEDLLDIKNKIYVNKSKIQEINQKSTSAGSDKKFKLMDTLRGLENDLNILNMNKQRLLNDKSMKEIDIANLEKDMSLLREQFNLVKSECISLDSIDTECPTCKRAFENEDIESKKQELIENFNQNKAKKLKDIQTKGVTKKQEVEKIQYDLKDISTKVLEFEKKIEPKKLEIYEIKNQIDNFRIEAIYSVIDKENIDKLQSHIESLEQSLHANNTVDTDILISAKRKISNEINDLNKTLAKQDLNKELENRKEELLSEEKRLGADIAQQEKIVMLCESFIKSRVSLLEERVSSKFEFVRFKFTKEQVNGGVEETCQPTVNGVPFDNLNTANQINAGLDIINTLSKHFEVQAPIFIDNRESINRLIEIDSQIINLIVTKDNPLKIENIVLEGVI